MSKYSSEFCTDLTIIFQGGIPHEKNNDGSSLLSKIISTTKAVFPTSKIVLSTWENEVVPVDISVDEIVLNQDPGALPPLKNNSSKANNVNRQIVSTLNGLKYVATKYAIKIRTDMYFDNASLLKTLSLLSNISGFEQRIFVSRFFSLTGKTFERIPYHISDWVQFGLTEKLLELWDVPMMNEHDATWFSYHPKSASSNFYESFFNAKFAVEQYIYMHYARKLGYATPAYFNDLSNLVQVDYELFISDRLVILDDNMWGVSHSKYPDISRSKFHDLNCLSYADWIWITKHNLFSRFLFIIHNPSYLLRLANIKLYGVLSANSKLPIFDYSFCLILKLATLKIIKKFKW